MEYNETELARDNKLDGEKSDEGIMCSININKNEHDNSGMECTNPDIDSHYLTVPNMSGLRLPVYLESETDGQDIIEKRARHKRSHSIHHVTSSGNSTPSRKLSVVSVDRHKRPLTSISRIGALSSNFLNASISNIHRCSSAKNLFSFFSNSQRGVRVEVTEYVTINKCLTMLLTLSDNCS